MIDLTISVLPAAPLHVCEIWGEPTAVTARFAAEFGFALPAMGRSAGTDVLRMIRYEPTVWLVEGDAAALPAVLADDGALTAIGGGTARVGLAGAGWRTLLMYGGVFDAENLSFKSECSATTIIEHVNVRLHVIDGATCHAYIPASFSAELIEFWKQTATIL